MLFLLFIFFLSIFSSNLNIEKGFSFGVATASYQIEGGRKSRGENIWDVFSHTPGKIFNNDTGDLADDSYNRYKEDIEIINELGVKYYRFSISWSRIFPKKNCKPSKEGIRYYNNVINGLLKKGISPLVTLYHWDLPTYLDWLRGDEVVEEFVKYAKTCFEEFGDRVKHFSTFNEPLTFCVQGYNDGTHAPGRCSNRKVCEEGDSGTEPYIVAHNVLLAHAKTYRMYHKDFSEQKGKLNIILNQDISIPYTNTKENIEATERSNIWKLAWFADPIYFGDYPEVMKQLVGDRLPKFTDEEKILLKGSSDFFGLNHYTTKYVYHKENSEKSWNGDQNIVETPIGKDGKPIGPRAEPIWLYVYPKGLRKVLNWVSKRYNYPTIWITENGVAAPSEGTLPYEQLRNDTFRQDYMTNYISEMFKARDEDGVKVTAYFHWSVLDNYEWNMGYSQRFGIVYIDRENQLERKKKDSYFLFKEIVKSKTF